MERRGKNKENLNPGKNRRIDEMFKVKKCLFDSTDSSSESPMKLGSPVSMDLKPARPRDDVSPFAMFHIRKRRSKVIDEKHGFTDNTTPLKRVSKMSFQSMDDEPSQSSPLSHVKIAVQKSMTETNLIGDFSKECILPIISGSHPDLRTVSPATIAELITTSTTLTFKIFDCRYPYEFDGGHIQDAINLYHKGEAETDFFSPSKIVGKTQKEEILIFYCEFSSQRAPGMIRFLRGKDRDLNKDCYPFLYYPEMYLIEGGYKAFYSSFKSLCVPQLYKQMLDKDCSAELSFYRSKCKSYSQKSKRSRRARTTALSFNTASPATPPNTRC